MEKLKIATERLFLRSPNINVCFRITIMGTIDRNTFDSAIHTVCKRHPLLQCSIKTDDNHDAWFIPDTSHVEIEYYKPEEMQDWSVWYKTKDGAPFDFLDGPLVKICVINDTDKTEIIVLGHHIIGDGIGYLNFINDMLLALDNKLEIIPQIPPVNNQFREGKKLGFLLKLYAKKMNKAWRKSRASFSENDYRIFFEQYRSKFIPEIYINSIGGTDLKKVIKKCRDNGLTVNDLISSAFSAAMIELSGNSPGKHIRLGIVANTRNELITEPYYCMGDYLTGISIHIKYSFEKDFITNAHTISKIIRKQLTNLKIRHLIVNFLNAFDTDLLESIMFASYGNHNLPISKTIGGLIKEGKNKKGLGISNLGRHEFSGYDAIKLLDMQFIGPAFPANLLSISIITVNNRLNICLRYNITELKNDVVEKIYKRAVELLLQ